MSRYKRLSLENDEIAYEKMWSELQPSSEIFKQFYKIQSLI